LQQHQIELAVLDINMPMLDGVQLLSVIQRRHPDVKKVVVTAHATDAYRDHVPGQRSGTYFSKSRSVPTDSSPSLIY
jgi:DNA-binding NarL/FixJ family response regulator